MMRQLRPTAPALVFVTLVAGVTGCARLLSSAGEHDTSSAYEPPPDWRSAIRFEFIDSATTFEEPWEAPDVQYGARIDFFDGKRARTAAGRDVFRAENGSIRTPWYRVHLADRREQDASLRITVVGGGGHATIVTYPLTVENGEFFIVRMGVYTLPSGGSVHLQGFRGYPVPEGVRALPGDSLWVGYFTKGRYCFNCLSSSGVPDKVEAGDPLSRAS